MERENPRRWTEQEDDRLVRQVKFGCQNLKNCFFIVADEIGRTPGAVANHWYTKTSKRPDVICFFTASQTYISKNRKNGVGVESNRNIWNRLIRAIQSIL